jgi:hypothetical protein
MSPENDPFTFVGAQKFGERTCVPSRKRVDVYLVNLVNVPPFVNVTFLRPDR